MADNIVLNTGSGGSTIKTDDDGTSHWQYVKMSFGADNTQTRVTSTTGLPVDLLAGTAEIGNVKNSGTFVVQEDGAALTALQVIDNIVHVDDAAFTLGTSSGVMMMGFAGTQSVDANDAGAISMETDGSIHIHDGGNTITVDGTVTANLSATDNAVLDQIEVNTSYGEVVGGGVEATALRVTLASDSTGVLSVDDGGGSLTIDGTVTANLSATDNAVLDQIEVNTSYGDNTGTGTESGALRVTLATDSTGLLSIDDNGGSLTIDNTDITTIAGAVSGTEMQVDVVAALPAGTNAIGKLAANSGVDIGDVDVLSIIPGTGATSLGKAVDSVVGATDTGVAMLAERIDVATAVTPAVADYSNLFCDKFGNLKVTQLPDADSIVKRGVINVAASGDNTLQAAAGVGIRIRVLSYTLISAGTVNVRFESAAGGDALTGIMPLVANSGVSVALNPHGHFETSANQLLNLELSAAVSVDGHFTYVEVTS